MTLRDVFEVGETADISNASLDARDFRGVHGVASSHGGGVGGATSASGITIMLF